MKQEDVAFALGSESERVEWKESGRNADEVLRAVCALANDVGESGRPGFLVLGVDKQARVVGTDASDKALTTLSDRLRSTKILPHPSVSIEVVSRDGKEFFFVVVARVILRADGTSRRRGRHLLQGEGP